MTGSEGMEPPVGDGRHLSIISSSRSEEDRIERAYHYTSPLPRAAGDAMGKGAGGATHRRPSPSSNAGRGEAAASRCRQRAGDSARDMGWTTGGSPSAAALNRTKIRTGSEQETGASCSRLWDSPPLLSVPLVILDAGNGGFG